MLPGEDGLDILTRIRADKATADVPVSYTHLYDYGYEDDYEPGDMDFAEERF